MNNRYFVVIAAVFILSACTTGKLFYIDRAGNRTLGCEVEFVGMPSVDKFAVEYALSHCAKRAVEAGHRLEQEQKYLLELDTSIPPAPCGKAWDHELAEDEFEGGNLSKKEYGYIVAHIDMGLAVVNECSSGN